MNDGKVLIQSANPKEYIQKKPHTSLVSGIPLLIAHGKIVQNLLQKDGEFYQKSHARTALGIKPDGTIIIIIAEHHYQKDLVFLNPWRDQNSYARKNSIIKPKIRQKSW